MNYRHAYHAGNFADVLKHATLALVIEHLKLKPAAFRVIDTHAGIGAYDLAAVEPQKTREWEAGIGRIFGAELPEDIAAILAPYLKVVAGENPDGVLRTYPGSPLIARRLMRRGDRLVANELHPEECAALRASFAHDPQTKVLSLDAWMALKALLPPKERRGVVLVDPPYEEPGELMRLARGLRDAARRFATGTILLWFPIKDPRAISIFRREIADLRLEKLLLVELFVGGETAVTGLTGTGLVVLNPPFTLEDKLRVLLPFLSERLAQGKGASARLEWLARSSVTTP